MSLDFNITSRFNTTNIAISEKIISQNLINNLPKHVCLMLACIISIDHEIRLQFTPALLDHINHCIDKLKHFLGHRVIADDNFTTIVLLFAVAISSDIYDFQQQDDILSKSEDIIINNLITIYFQQTSLEEQNTLKLVLKILLRTKNSPRLIDSLPLEPTIFCRIIMKAIRQHQHLVEINNQINLDLRAFVNITAAHSKKLKQFKQVSSKIMTTICTIAIGGVTTATAGATLALLVVPSAILAIKYAPKIGEKIGQMLLTRNKFMLKEQEKIIKLNTKLNLDPHQNKFVADQQLVPKAEFYKINQQSNTPKKDLTLHIEHLASLTGPLKDNLLQDKSTQDNNLNQKIFKDNKAREQIKERERQR